MRYISIPLYRITPAPLTGMGWVAVQKFDALHRAYLHVASFRSADQAEAFIEGEEKEV